MNDQQSSPVPDPQSHNPRPESSLNGRSVPAPPSDNGDVAALSDQEAFLMLAMSMSDDAVDPESAQPASSDLDTNGWSVEFSGDQQTGSEDTEDTNVQSEREASDPGLSAASSESDQDEPVNEVVSPLPVSPVQPDIGAGSALDAPEAVIDLRAQSPFLTAMAGKLSSRRADKSWSPAAVTGDQWEVYEGIDDDGPIHGRVTEIVDLSQVPPPLVDYPAADRGEAVVPGDSGAERSTDETDEHLAESRSATPTAPPEGVRLLPPPQECGPADSDLPPLVFLNTQGDIMPTVRHPAPADSRPPRISVEWGEDGLVTNEEQGGNGTPDDSEGSFESGVALGVLDGPTMERPTHDEVDDDIFDVNNDDIFDVGNEVIGNHIAPEGADENDTDPDSTPVVNVPMSVWQEPDLVYSLDEAGRLFDQYCGPVVAVIASVAKDRRAIDEAIQETFLTAWESMDSFDPEEPRGPWMFTLARRTGFEQVAVGHQLAVEANEYPEPSHRELEVPVDLSWEAWEVRLAVDQLPAAEYEVLRLIHREGLIHPEVASEMNSTIGAVKSRAYSGSHRLIELLDHVIRPDADADLTEDQASALTWYLAGVADGSDLDPGKRSAVKRVRDQLASPTAWITPDPGARDRLLEVVREAVEIAATQVEETSTSAESMPAADQETPQDNGRVPVVEPEEAGLSALPAPAAPIVAQVPETPPFELPTAAPSVIDSLVRQMGSSGATAEPSGDVDLTGRLRPITTVDDDTRPPITSILIGAGLLLVAVLVMTNLFGLLDADDGLARTYQLQPTEIDADATAVVHLAPADTGTQFEFEFGGLDASSEDDFYSVWLQRTADGAVAPLGSFHWDVSGSKVVLSGPTGHDDYDMIVITQSSRTAEASATDPVVLSAAID